MKRGLGLAALVLLVLGGALSTPVSALEFECRKVGRQPVIFARGEIEPTDAAAFRKLLPQCRKQAPGTLIVDLDSVGGALSSGMDMGLALMSVGAHTRVSPGKVCISACVFTFLGGKFREVMPGGTLEPHGFSSWRFNQNLLDVSNVTAAMYLRPQWFPDGCPDCRRLCRHFPKFSAQASEVLDYCEGFGVRDGALAFPRSVTAEGKVLPHPDDKRKASVLVDGGMVLSTAMMELERDVALRYLRDGSIEGLDEARYVGWVYEGFRQVVASHYGKASVADAAPDPGFVEDVSRVVRGTASSAQGGAVAIRDFFTELRRHDPIDTVALTKLMFSTSIIYTRPLTSKEMCRSGVVTIAIDC